MVGGGRLVNFLSNDYLGLSTDPRLAEAAMVAMQEYGVGAGASRLITGNVALVEILEEQLVRFHGAGSACVFSSGFAANTGLLPVIAGPSDFIFSDELNHASII